MNFFMVPDFEVAHYGVDLGRKVANGEWKRDLFRFKNVEF